MSTEREARLTRLLDLEERHKLVINHTLNNLNERDVLNARALENSKDDIDKRLAEIEKIKNELTELLPIKDLTSHGSDTLKFTEEVKKDLDALTIEVYQDVLPPPCPGVEPQQHVQGLTSTVRPIVKCPEFDGLDTDNRFALRDFITRFEYCTSGLNSRKEKLTFLKSCVTGRPFRLIHHLREIADNYEVALQILKDDYWDEEAIREDIFSRLFLLDTRRHYEAGYLKEYLSQLKYELAELDSSMRYRFLRKDSGSGALAAHILIQRLPGRLREELVRIKETPYPDLNSILEDGVRILKSWKNTLSGREPDRRDDDWRNTRITRKGLTPPTLENFHIQEEQRACNFCLQDGHEAQECKKYSTYQQRQRRCSELGLCYRCTSSNHFGYRCPLRNDQKHPCRKCSAYDHTATMCPGTSASNGCMNTGMSDRQCLLPISRISLRRGNRTVEARCLVDTGSQNSYFSQNILNSLQCDPRSVQNRDLEIVTFLGRRRRRFKQITVMVLFPSGISRQLPVLIDGELNLHHRIEQLPTLINNFQELDLQLDTDLGASPDIILDGLLGVDLLQFMGTWEIVECMNGVAWATPRGMIPFGDPRNFLYPHQEGTTASNGLTAYDETVNSMMCPNSLVNNIIHARPSYPDPYQEIFSESAVDRGLEWIYSIESLGLTEEETLSDYDVIKVNEFMSHIDFREGCYWVKLPWHTEKLAKVDSNYRVAIKVLDKVVNNLEEKGLYEDYMQVFAEQEAEKIIEPFECPSNLYHRYVWIPHRPVFKSEDTTTTRIRPVFNCSLKARGGVSLNDAAYPGVNLTGDMFNLTLLFRTNRYTLLGDIRKAFLMIRLSEESDKNKFCFFLKQGNYLKCYRYTTIIFGFNASPFILNCILKYHASKFPADECSTVLSSRFYVDNLVTTCNSKDGLKRAYQLARERLENGGFKLRSCNSNCPDLQKSMQLDETLTTHGCLWEKVLGYRYDPTHDAISLNQRFCSSDLTTKRLILSAASGIFDPLSLCLPVTIQSRILVGEMWKAGLDWDEPIPKEMTSNWSSLANELSQLHSLSFKRRVFNEDDDVVWCVFSDASKKAYGFTLYAIQGGECSLLFAKAKVAPLKTKTLPTLELLAAFLAMKCLVNVLKTYKGTRVIELYLAVDSQIVLTWLLSKVTCNKSVFVKNRLKDIGCMEAQIQEDYGLTIRYKYVPSKQNPADLITRGLTTSKLKENITFWCSGPSWLADKTISWPDSDLGCLSADNQQLIRADLYCTREGNCMEPIINLDRFSSFKKLVAVVSRVYEFVNKLRGRLMNFTHLATNYLFKMMQAQAFPVELEYLCGPSDKPVPARVGQLNLFIDESGIIRSRGRIGKNISHRYEVLNPVLLGKNHPLTDLIVRDIHKEVKHLGVPTTLSRTRMAGFWIPQGRQAIKGVLKTCCLCKRFNNVPFTYPALTDLPRHRVNLLKPFLHTGMDYTGHLWIGDQSQRSKVYILIFTCMEIRAVHLELVEDMTARSFILAFTRFVNMWGLPSHLYSDNAKSFITGGDLLQQALTADEFEEKFKLYNLKHVRIPLHSPWYGGVWERVINTLKKCLYKTIGRSICSYSELLTTISDIQRAVNDRPLTYVSSNSCAWEVITPNHFLHTDLNPNILVRLDNTDINVGEVPTKQRLIDSLRNRDELLKEFKRIWHEDYLLSLREQHQGLNATSANLIQIGDIVSVKLPNKSRPFWALGRVVKLFHGDDGVARSAQVMQGDGNIHNHAINHLYPLELQAAQPSDLDEGVRHTEEGQEEDGTEQIVEQIWICPECDLPDDGSAMICCDQCNFWFHFECAGIGAAPPIEDEWFCHGCQAAV